MKTDRFSICSGVVNRIRLVCGQYKIRIAGFFSVMISLRLLRILLLSRPLKMKSIGIFGHQVQPATISKFIIYLKDSESHRLLVLFIGSLYMIRFWLLPCMGRRWEQRPTLLMWPAIITNFRLGKSLELGPLASYRSGPLSKGPLASYSLGPSESLLAPRANPRSGPLAPCLSTSSPPPLTRYHQSRHPSLTRVPTGNIFHFINLLCPPHNHNEYFPHW